MVRYLVVAVTVMRVLFVLDVSMLRECKGDGKAGVGHKGEGVVHVVHGLCLANLTCWE